ncbi:MAG: hypothetical protein ACR2N3_19045 [Pyrinomonadaceae bacterium]
MKICPHCQTTYTDDSLKFCLQDGSPLVNQTISQNWSAAETLVSANPNVQTPNWTNSEQTRIIARPQKSGTGLVIALTALITLLVIGGAVAGYLFYRNNRKIETAQNNNVNAKTVNVNFPVVTNTNQKANTNLNSNAAPSPSVAPTVKPTLNPKEAETVKADIRDVIENWKDSSENRDINAHLDNYADTVDYYRGGKVSVNKVRADKEKAYSDYDDIEINIDNVKIMPDETGGKAVVILDKEWNFQNDVKSNSGKVQQQLTFGKIGGRWLITGEKDLKVYYANKNHN